MADDPMDRWKGCVALVTMASSAIGAEICRELVKYGVTVVGIARNVKKLRAISREDAVDKALGHLFAIKCDLSHEDDIIAVFEKIRDDFGRIDICINNAGFSALGPLINGQTDVWRNMLDVNVLSLCICTRESLKLMKEKNINYGQIIHICSLDAHSSQPDGFYSATKYMVRGLADSLRTELREANSRIRVACITPGHIETGIDEPCLEDSDKAKDFYDSMQCLTPLDVSKSVIYILSVSSRADVRNILIRPADQKT